MVVAVSAKNEAELIGRCLRALSQQQDASADAIVLVVNNSSDNTADLVRASFPQVLVVEHAFPAQEASAGAARRMAMERAATLLDAGGVLLTTDADGRVPPDWIAANSRAIGDGRRG